MDQFTEALCEEYIIESYFRMIDSYKTDIINHENRIRQLMSMLVAEAGRTFRYKGQIYQVCQRKEEGTYFFKLLDKPPKSWLSSEARRCRSKTLPDTASPEETSVITPEAEALPEGMVAASATE